MSLTAPPKRKWAKIPVSCTEAVAEIVYGLTSDGKVRPEWKPFGTSDVQWEARRVANRILEVIFANPEYETEEQAILNLAVDRMGWPEINEFNHELRRGQDVREDAGGYFMRAIRRLFGLGTTLPTVETYQSAARKMMEELYDE